MTTVAPGQRSALLWDLIQRGVPNWWTVLSDPEGPINVVDVDWVEVLRMLDGHPTTHDIATRKVAVDVLRGRRHAAPEIARRIGTTPRTVERLVAPTTVGRPDELLTLVVAWAAPGARR